MTVACASCGAEQLIPTLPAGGAAFCRRCDSPLERTAGRSQRAGLACSLAMLVLLLPANLLPVLRSHLANLSREAHIAEAALVFWNDGWPLVAVLTALFVIVLPFLRALALSLVLGSLQLGWRTGWQGRLFRYAEEMRLWAMPEVMLLGAAVTYSRVTAQLSIELLVGGWCFIGVAVLSMITEGSIDRRRLWRSIHPDRQPMRGEQSVGCSTCDLVMPIAHEGQPCPRCRKTLHVRRPNALNRCAALTAAAYILYVPAYLFPMTQTVRPTGLTERTIIDGVHELFTRGFWYLGLIVFVASVAIPFLKLVGLTWLMLRVKYPSKRRLPLRTKAHRAIHEINRWSLIDPYIVAMTAPMMAYPGIVDVGAGPGALPFMLVVVLTMLASRFFDTRLLWDSAERRL